jgi:hypothetical protein
LSFDLISRREPAEVASLFGWLRRSLDQVNIVGSGWIELKPADVGAFERLGSGAEQWTVRRRSYVGQLNQGVLTSAACDGADHRPGVELYEYGIEDQMENDRQRKQNLESCIFADS